MNNIIKMNHDFDPLWILPKERYIEATENLRQEMEKIKAKKERIKKINKKIRSNIEYDIWDKIETILGDIWYIIAITIYTSQVEYCVWIGGDKKEWLLWWQIKCKR